MRESDRILAEDLWTAGLRQFARRAEGGEWNDYFGVHDNPRQNLIIKLRHEPRLANAVRKQLIQNALEGKYNATTVEAEEWAASPEGRDVIGRHAT